MEPITLIPASEAKEQSIKNAITLDGLIITINNQIKNGCMQARFFDVYFTYELYKRLWS